MSSPPMMTTISTKGQVILPKAIRDNRNWSSGTRLIVEETVDGVVLKAERSFPVSRYEDVFGSLSYGGPPMTIEDMNEAVLEEARRRHDSGRY